MDKVYWEYENLATFLIENICGRFASAFCRQQNEHTVCCLTDLPINILMSNGN